MSMGTAGGVGQVQVPTANLQPAAPSISDRVISLENDNSGHANAIQVQQSLTNALVGQIHELRQQLGMPPPPEGTFIVP